MRQRRRLRDRLRSSPTFAAQDFDIARWLQAPLQAFFPNGDGALAACHLAAGGCLAPHSFKRRVCS
jgi:hypothetical protein